MVAFGCDGLQGTRNIRPGLLSTMWHRVVPGLADVDGRKQRPAMPGKAVCGGGKSRTWLGSMHTRLCV